MVAWGGVLPPPTLPTYDLDSNASRDIPISLSLPLQNRPPDGFAGCTGPYTDFFQFKYTWCNAVLANHLYVITVKLCVEFMVYNEGCLAQTSNVCVS